MLSYLENMMLRLAVGVGRLPDASRRRHAEYLLAAQNDDGGFSGRQGESDLYYTGFALRGLALTGELSGPPAVRAARFLSGSLAAPASIVDFMSLIYGSVLLEMSEGIDVFGQGKSETLAEASCETSEEQRANARRSPDWREAAWAHLERFRRDDGGYAKNEAARTGSTYHTFLVVLCHELLKRPIAEPAAIARFVRSRRREDGGFVEVSLKQQSGTNPTAAAVGLLRILDELDEPIRRGTIEFLARMQNQEGGVRANGRIPMADLLSTFTGMLTLADLDGLDAIDLAAARRYVQSIEQPGGGFHGGVWDDETDVEYTFYGLGALALLDTQ
jgi:geranylgeranyl transferase type-2 subunit beta